ncbi:hypothetical protein DM01DRAFT_1349880 [Hesseltinella vesiculosa]|uniref:Uncharacterized protein n=1 Tax=Hesseltinella vesiculosa TaxID=101127 RepID=A0A1X2G3H3_9FUNG|nr:hypothetical protein DM01DRAFT_1349880 [Hesseltinella vesiculosa]
MASPARIKYLEGVMASFNVMEEPDLTFAAPFPEEVYDLDELALSCGAGAAIPNADALVRRLESLQDVLARILWKEPDMVLADPLLAHYAMNLDLSSNEACALKKIYHVLKPYVVPEQPNYCHLNLLFFGSALLRLCGYDQLAMPYAPNDTTGSLNALPMDAAILFEMFGSTLEIKRDHGINAAIDAFHDKEKVFGCLFDMTVIRDICKEDGIDFSYSLDINPANEVSLQGLVPSQVYEQRLKQAKSDLQLLSSQHTLDSLKIDIAEAQVERNRRAKTKRDTFNALMIHQSVMKATDYSNPSMLAEPKEASSTTPTIHKVFCDG